MEENPLLSVCITTYQQAPYIAQCLDSVLMQQTTFPFEVILGEDDSTDGTREICQDYAVRYPEKIRLFLRSEKDKIYINGVKTGRFNFTENLKAARGKYIALIEGDDYWTDLEKLQRQVDFLESHGDYVICAHNATVIDGQGHHIPHVARHSDFSWNRIQLDRTDLTIEDLIRSPCFSTASVMFKKPMPFEFPAWFYKVPSGDMALEMMLCGDQKIKYFNECLSVYRKHAGGITAHHSGDYIHIGRIFMYLRIFEYYHGKYEAAIKRVIFSHLKELRSLEGLSPSDLAKAQELVRNMKQLTFVAYGPNQINGPNIWLQRMLPALQACGLLPKVLFLMYSNDPCQVVENLRGAGIECHLRPFQKYTEQNIITILQYLHGDPPDIFIPNLSVAAYFSAKWVKQAGIPTVGIIRSDDNFHHELIDCFVAGYPEYRVSGVVCKSTFLADAVIAKNIDHFPVLRAASGTTIPTEIAQKPAEQLHIVYTGRLVQRQKRIFDVITTLQHVVTTIPETYATIYGKDEEGGKAIEMIKDLNLGERLQYGGLLNMTALFPALLRQHVFVLLSDYEGMSTSLMEAMACGLVPICTKTRSGAMQIIRHNENGLLVENRDEDFVNAVRRLKCEAGLWERLSQAARYTIEQQYTLDIQADRWVAFLNGLTSTPSLKKEIVIPALDEIRLPPVKETDYGMCREDRRMPIPNDVVPTDNFIQIKLRTDNIDVYCIRTAILRALKKHIVLFSGTLLDIGCGQMPYKEFILTHSNVERYIGLDLEQGQNYHNVRPDLLWDGKTIPLDDESIDCAIATEVFEHVPDLKELLQETVRVLKPNGVMFFTTPFLWPLHDVPHDEYRYTPFALQRHLQDAGLADIQLNALGGWDASLVQMIGLWGRRRKMSARKRKVLAILALPVIKWLLRRDTPPKSFLESSMITGVMGIAFKRNA